MPTADLLAASNGSSPIAGLLPIILIIAVFYVLIIRPQRRRMAAMRETLTAVEPGRRVMTTAGLYGEVTAVVDDEVELEVAPGVRTRWAKAAIARVLPLPGDSPEPPESPGSATDQAGA